MARIKYGSTKIKYGISSKCRLIQLNENNDILKVFPIYLTSIKDIGEYDILIGAEKYMEVTETVLPNPVFSNNEFIYVITAKGILVVNMTNETIDYIFDFESEKFEDTSSMNIEFRHEPEFDPPQNSMHIECDGKSMHYDLFDASETYFDHLRDKLLENESYKKDINNIFERLTGFYKGDNDE